MQPYDRPGSLMAATQHLLKDRDLLSIYKDTHLPYHWLVKFKAGTYKNPSVNRVQYLYEYLTSKPLL